MGKQLLKKREFLLVLWNQGYEIGYTTVCNYIRERGKAPGVKEAYIRQEYQLGDICEFDWGEVKLIIGGIRMKVNMSAFTSAKNLTKTVLKFRFDQANEILAEGSRIVKAINPDLKVIQRSLPADNHFYSTRARGFDKWEHIAFNPNYDVFSTSILVNGNDTMVAHRNLAKKTVSLAKQNNKPSQRWIQSFFRPPENLNTIKDIVRIYAEEGVDSIFSWTYRAGQDTFLSVPDPQKVWDILGDAYGEVLNLEI